MRGRPSCQGEQKSKWSPGCPSTSPKLLHARRVTPVRGSKLRPAGVSEMSSCCWTPLCRNCMKRCVPGFNQFMSMTELKVRVHSISTQHCDFLHIHDLSLNHEGLWGTKDDFTSSVFHFSPFSIALWDLANSSPLHSLLLSL